MIAVERNYADRSLILLHNLMPIFPDELLPQLQTLEQQLNELSCDEDLIILILYFLKKYVFNNNEPKEREVFFENSEDQKDSNSDGVNVKIEELIAVLNNILVGQNNIKFKGIIR